MIRYELTNEVGQILGPVTIELPVQDTEGRSRPIVSAPEESRAQQVRDKLRNASALYGHTMPATPTGPELHGALTSDRAFAEYDVRLIEGETLTAGKSSYSAVAEAIGLKT